MVVEVVIIVVVYKLLLHIVFIFVALNSKNMKIVNK